MTFKANKLKYAEYFLNSVYPRRPYLTEEKIQNVLLHHDEKLVQENGRISYTGYDLEANKFLKVIVEIVNDETIIFNAYYNRNFKRNEIKP